jgi:hypothetical protein
MLIEPAPENLLKLHAKKCRNSNLLEITLAPGLVEPVSGVRISFTELVGNSLVVLTGRSQQGIAGTGRRVRNSMAIKEALELTLTPSGVAQRKVSV